MQPMNMTTRGPGRRGQVLVITAFSLMGLMAIAAIVIDLGFSWMLRRQEQNAADPGAITAARWIEEVGTLTNDEIQGKMEEVACFYAQENGFFEGDVACATALDEGNRNLEVIWPPSGPHAGEFAGRPEMVLVVIRSDHPSFFGRIFGQSTAVVATGAVAARETASANSNSLVALDPSSCGAGKTHGGGTITIEPVVNDETGELFNGGYVHVNSDCGEGAYDDACGSGNGGFHLGGNGGASLDAPHLYVHGTCQESGGELTSPVTEGAPQIGDPLYQLVGPRQAAYPAGHCPTKQGNSIVYVDSTPTSNGCKWNTKDTTVVLTPGVYWGGWDFSGQNVTVRLEPGIYIIAGGGVNIKGTAELNSTPAVIGGSPDPLDPARILIFSTDNTTDPACASSSDARCIQGKIEMAGQSSLQLWGLDSGPWRGLLMWQDRKGSNPTAPINLVGQGVMNLAGTIYAPLADVKITGNGDAEGTRLAVQIISWTWDIGGNGELFMPYDPNQLYKLLQRGLVH
jgi:hypothetical protein